jgi:hypothetical protein
MEYVRNNINKKMVAIRHDREEKDGKYKSANKGTFAMFAL